uniref:Laminin G domain-containing protein n=1 Tax=Ditylenchus dipsaci TaxID=166011 RepID=A0A915DIC2_9BILA
MDMLADFANFLCLLEHVKTLSFFTMKPTLASISKDKVPKFFPVTYKLFSPLQIQELMSRSERCEQYIRYYCNNAPLNFHHNSTWFITSASENYHISQIGNIPNTCACKTSSEGCAHGSQYADKSDYCNCDVASAITFDEGTLLNKNSAISSVYLRPNHPQGHANLTLGQLKCRGEKGNLDEKTVTLKAQSARLELQLSNADKHAPFTQLEFDFKTSQKDVESMVYGNSFQGDQSNLWFISLKMGHRLAFQIDIYDKMENSSSNNNFVLNTINVSMMSQTKLNDLKWHRVIIEVFRDEIRFSVDNSHEFKQIHMSIHSFTYLFYAKVFIGSLYQRSGFTGCVRNFRVNNRLLELKMSAQQILLLDVQITVGNTVVNKILSAFTTFKTTNFLCEQKLRCELPRQCCWLFEIFGRTLARHPLNTGIVFSVRTDQKSALLAYAHDQFDNFIQIHLSDEYKLCLQSTMTPNCKMYSACKAWTQFNDMRWLQIVLEQTLDQITMSVDDEVCEITGPHLLSQRKIDAFTGSFEGVILPPQPAGPVVAATPYYFLFVGGLPSVQHTRIKRDRIAYYVTDIPGLLGYAVRTGCYNDCDTLVCHNGGHCTVQWQNYDPTNQERTGCDCSKTSYYGSNCLKDTGLTFTGDSSIVLTCLSPNAFFYMKVLHLADSQLFFFGGEAVELEEEEDEEDESGEQDQDLNQEGGLKQQFFSPDDLLIHKRRKRNVSEAVEVIGLSLDASNVTKGETEDGLEASSAWNLAISTKDSSISSNFGNFVESDQIVPWWMWLIVLLVLWLMLMILLCCICRVCCCKRKKNRKREINKNDLEGKPILSNDGNPLKKKVVIKEPPIRLVFRLSEGAQFWMIYSTNGTEPPEKNTHFDFPSNSSDDHEPNYHNYPKSQPLPLLKRQPSVDQSSVPSFSTIPSEKEYFPELEEEEDLDDFEDVDSVLAKGFDEKLPDVWMRAPAAMTIDRSNPSRMSSFGCK